MGTPLEYLALDRITRLRHFRYTHTRYNRENELISHDTGPHFWEYCQIGETRARETFSSPSVGFLDMPPQRDL